MRSYLWKPSPGGGGFFFGGAVPPSPRTFLIWKAFFLGEGIGGAAPKPPGGGRHIAAAPLHSPGSKGGYPLHPLLISQGQSFPPCLASFGRWVCALLTTVALAHVALCILILEIAVRAPRGGSGGSLWGRGRIGRYAPSLLISSALAPLPSGIGAIADKRKRTSPHRYHISGDPPPSAGSGAAC